MIVGAVVGMIGMILLILLSEEPWRGGSSSSCLAGPN